jgi:hypothetical protein
MNCFKCGTTNLEWVKVSSKWKLIDPETGEIHSITCHVTKSEYETLTSVNIPANAVCAHGILRTHACDSCDAMRRNDMIEF